MVKVVKVVKVGLHLQQRLGDGWWSKHSADGGASVSSRRKEASKNSYSDLAGLPSQGQRLVCGIWSPLGVKAQTATLTDCVSLAYPFWIRLKHSGNNSGSFPRRSSACGWMFRRMVWIHSFSLSGSTCLRASLAEAPPHAFQPPVPNTQTIAQAAAAVWDGGKSSSRRLLQVSAATLAPAAASSVVFLAAASVRGRREGGREALTFLKAHRCWVWVLGPGGHLRWHQAALLVGGDGSEGTDLHSRHTFQLPFKWKHQRENTD